MRGRSGDGSAHRVSFTAYVITDCATIAAHRILEMNSTSLLVVIIATLIGAVGAYYGVRAGMDASDSFASRLSVTSTDYVRQREKARADGLDPSKVTAPAARTQRPGTYDEALTAAKTSPYVRADSDVAQRKEAALRGENLEGGSAASNSTGNTASSGNGGAAANANSQNANDQLAYAGEATGENGTYTVHDEIRRQLATEEMSDTKREALESLLPKEAMKPVRAIDVRMKFDSRNCVVPRNSNSWIGVMFRPKSSAIRGTSLNDLDELILLRERCDGVMIVEDTPIELSNSTAATDSGLQETRRDEVKYYLLQKQVPKESIQTVNR